MNATELEATDDDAQTPEQFDGQISDLRQEAGTSTTDTFHHLPVLEDIGHPLVPDVSHTFYDQSITEDMSLLDYVTYSMADEEYSTLLIGETGAGKNTVIDHICANTNRPRVRVNFGVNITYDELVGHYSPVEGSPSRTLNDMTDLLNYMDDADHEVTPGEALNSVSAGSSFNWQEGILAMAVEYGWVFVGDEINAAGGEVTTPLHGVTDDKDKRELVIRETGEVVSPHEEFIFCGTMNPIQYAGTKEMNQAFRDRFYCIDVDYLEEDNEVELIADVTGISDDEARSLVDFATDLRLKLGEEVLTPISPRDLMKIGRLANDTGFTLNQAAHNVVGSMAKAGDREVISKQIDMRIS